MTPEQTTRKPEQRIQAPNTITVESGGKTVERTVSTSQRPVVNKHGLQIGTIYELDVPAEAGDQKISATFKISIDPEEEYNPLVGGWHHWSGPARFKAPLNPKRTVGMHKPFASSLGDKTAPFIEPGPGKEQIPNNIGRSYGFVGFRGSNGENAFVGIIPSLDAIEYIEYQKTDQGITVSIKKDLEGSRQENRRTKVSVFAATNNPRLNKQEGNYADLTQLFSNELEILSKGRPHMKDRVIGFSWPAHSISINQGIIEREARFSQGIADTYIIDAGWEKTAGSMQVDTQKFPNLQGLATQMKEFGLRPGIHVSPFFLSQEQAANTPEEWLMHDAKGKRLVMPLPTIDFSHLNPIRKSYMYDISNPDFRKHLAENFANLARMGFETFKVDFLSVPFIGPLQNRDKTSVEYFRQTFEEIRAKIEQETGQKPEFIGCGAPMMESIGMFEGTRFTPDSAFPNLTNIPAFYGPIIKFALEHTPAGKILEGKNTAQYRAAISTAARRVLPFGQTDGLILDSIHLNDPKIPLQEDRKNRIAESILALKSLGITNLFIGDSLERVGEKGRQEWAEYTKRFREAPLRTTPNNH